MRDRAAVYVGCMLVLIGTAFLLMNLLAWLVAGLDVRFATWRLWPLLIVLVGVAFVLPPFLWWRDRARLSGLFVPGMLILGNGILFLYNSLSGDWRAWAYFWTLQPVFLALALAGMYLLGGYSGALLFAAAFLGGVGLLLFAVFGSFFGGAVVGLIAPFLMIVAGGLVILVAVLQRLRTHTK